MEGPRIEITFSLMRHSGVYYGCVQKENTLVRYLGTAPQEVFPVSRAPFYPVRAWRKPLSQPVRGVFFTLYTIVCQAHCPDLLAAGPVGNRLKTYMEGGGRQEIFVEGNSADGA